MKNIQLFKYQEEGIDLICNKYKDVLLADHPGAGKTCQAIIAAERLGCKSVLVICPASLKENWKREFKKWSEKEFDLTVMSYDKTIKGYPSKLNGKKEVCYDLLILDEAHYLKNPISLRTKFCLRYFWEKAKKRICITGTPLPNGRAIEAWPLFSKLDPNTFKSKQLFIDTYCVKQVTPWGVNFNSSKNLVQLGNIARENFMIRRKREDTVGQLPPIIRQKIFLNTYVSSSQYQIDPEKDLTKEIKSEWRKLGIQKVDSSLQYIIHLLNEVKNCVVFAHHTDVIEALKRGLDANNITNCLLIGSMNGEERQKSVDEFQAGNHQVFLGSIHAANVGITLTASSDIVFVECDWVPATNEQAEGRCFRISQTSITRSHYLIIPDSLDEVITSAVLKKQKDILKIMRN